MQYFLVLLSVLSALVANCIKLKCYGFTWFAHSSTISFWVSDRLPQTAFCPNAPVWATYNQERQTLPDAPYFNS